jgi:hypothetical protein
MTDVERAFEYLRIFVGWWLKDLALGTTKWFQQAATS